jgi:hypothetical protein
MSTKKGQEASEQRASLPPRLNNEYEAEPGRVEDPSLKIA